MTTLRVRLGQLPNGGFVFTCGDDPNAWSTLGDTIAEVLRAAADHLDSPAIPSESSAALARMFPGARITIELPR